MELKGKSGKYYCIPGIGNDNKAFKLIKPLRIAFIEDSHPILPSNITGYQTLKELRKNDLKWRAYHSIDPKSAVKICQEKFILTSKYFVFTPMDDEFDKISYKLLRHTVFGDLQKEITGIHLYSEMNPYIKTITEKHSEDDLGVWVADIEYYSPERNQTYKKEGSSMFPKSWDPTIFMFKIYFAFKHKTQCINDINIFHSFTDCGIRVDFIIRNNSINTVYPIYQYKRKE